MGDYETKVQGQVIPAKIFVDKEQLLLSAMQETTFLSYKQPLRMQVSKITNKAVGNCGHVYTQ